MLGDAPSKPSDHRRRWLLRCACGMEVARQADSVVRGTSTRCIACQRRKANETHGESKPRTPEYSAWLGIQGRAGRERWYFHVTVAPEWLGPDGYQRFLEHMGRRPSSKHSVDRIDPAKGYEPGNVRWATMKEQQRNRRNNKLLTIQDRTQCVAAWAEEAGVNQAMINKRLAKGWEPEAAVFTPSAPLNLRRLG